MPDSVALLEQLIGFPTVSRDSNLGLIEFVRGRLNDAGVEARLVANAEGTKANLFATIGPAGTPGVILSGHTDVVPTEGQDVVLRSVRAAERTAGGSTDAAPPT